MTAPTGPDRTGVVARLDALEAARKAATPGPWENPYPFTKLIDGPDTNDNLAIVQCDNAADAAAIVAEHNAFPELLAAVRGVLALADELDAEGTPAVENLDDWVRGRAHGITAAADWIRATVAAALGEA